MFRGRWIILGVIAFVGLGLAIGFVHVDHDDSTCLGKKTWHLSPWQTIFSIGHYELRYRPVNWDCDEKYNPKTSHPYVGPGELPGPVQ